MKTMFKLAALACATLSPVLATGAAHAQAAGSGGACADRACADNRDCILRHQLYSFFS